MQMTKIINLRNNILNHLSTIQAMNKEYATAFTETNLYFVNLKELDSPTKSDFAHNPKTLDEICQCYSEIMNISGIYTDRLYGQIRRRPGLCLNALLNINDDLCNAQKVINDAINYINRGIINKETLEGYATSTNDFLGFVIGIALQQKKDIDGLIANLEKFASEYINTLNENMCQILKDVNFESIDYDNKLQELIDLEAQLRKEINENIAAVVGGAVLTSFCLVAAIVGVVAAVVSGGGSLVVSASVLGGIAAIGGTMIPLGFSSYDLYQSKQDLEKTLAEIDGYKADLLEFGVIKSEIEGVKSKLSSVRDGLTIMADAWGGVSDGFKEIQTEICKATIETKKANENIQIWCEVYTIIENCITKVEKLEENVKSLIVSNLKVSKAKIEIGMSAEQVKEALESSESIDFKDYMLAV